MRRIMHMLSEIRQLQLEKVGADATRLSEVADKFRWFDSELSGVRRHTSTRVEEVMTSADFAYAIEEFVQRQMFPAYKMKRFEFEQFVKPDTTPNWLAVTRLQRRAQLDDLEYVPEKGQARPGSVVDATKKQWRVYKWEKQFDFSREALENDDLGYFQDHATEMGLAARRTLEKYVSRFMWNAVTIARLVALGALYSTTGRLTTARISACRMAFNQRVDDRGNPKRAALKFIIHHAGLVDTVAQIQRSTLVPELATNAENVVRGTFTPIEDPHCAGTAPNLPWFGVNDWRADNMIAFVLARKQGVPGAVMQRKKSDVESIISLLGPGTVVPPILGDFDTGNVVVKVADVWGTYIDPGDNTHNGNLVDYRGGYYSSGTAP